MPSTDPELIIADYHNTQHGNDILFLLNEYAKVTQGRVARYHKIHKHS